MLLGTLYENEQKIIEILENRKRTNIVPVCEGNMGRMLRTEL